MNAGILQAAEWIAPRLGRSEIYIVGATKAAADEFARSLGEHGSLGLHRLTLVQLASTLAARAMAERGLAPLTQLASEAIAARAIHKLHKAKKLDYLNRVARYPGLPSALASTLSDLRLAGVKAPEGDLLRLMQEYERELDTRKLADLALVFDLAEAPAFPVLLMDLNLPSRAHERFVDKLGEKAEVFRVVSAPQQGITALDHLRSYLFSTGRPPATEYDTSLDYFSAPGEGLEAVEIARRIRFSGTPFDRVAILLRSPERYQFLVEEALRRAGVPSYFSRGSARPDPAGRAFLALLHCKAENCSATRFAEYLSLGEIPELSNAAPQWTPPEDDMLPLFDAAPAESASEAEPPAIATPIAWEKLLVDAAVIGGRERWFRRLRGLEQEFKLQMSVEPGEYLEGRLERLQNLERFALPIIDLLDALPKAADWGDWLEHLRTLAAASLRHSESVLAVLAELEPMSGIGPIEIDEVLQTLAGRLRFLRRDPPHRRYGRVFVGSIEEARGRSFDVVFLPGLAEGVFPRRTFEDPLLLDETRRALSEALPLRQDKSEDERELLRIALAAAEKRFVFSYPSMDLAQGRPRVPSLFALELARALEGRVPRLQEFERRSGANAEAHLVWPAPRSPEHAIDDAEYDLAWHAAHADEKSGSSYLIATNHFLANSLRARIRRWDNRSYTVSDGLIAKNDAVARELLFTQRRLAARAYSPSALQQFSTCPYKFYLHGVYGLQPREQQNALEQMDPLTRGALFHAVQFEFFRAWRSSPSDMLPAALDLLDASLEKVAAEYKEKLAPAIERVWLSEIEDVRTDLRAWLRLWFASLAEWEPVHFELAFGLRRYDRDRYDAASIVDPAVLTTGTQVRGSIDLVERHRTRDVLRITDHKTGRPPEKEPVFVGGGAVMQPALYALAVESMLGATVESGRLFHCTQRGGFAEYPVDVKRARPWFEKAMEIIDDAIVTGFFPAAPHKEACERCDYSAVCGPYEQMRVQRWKEQESLEPLATIRRMP